MNTLRDAAWDEYMAEAMRDPVEAAAYLDAILEMDDPAALMVALRHVAEAHSMADVSRRACRK